MKLVVVESPAKAKTINKYLGKDYEVLASFGHIRDLPSKDGSVDPEHDFAMKWELNPQGKKHLGAITKALKDADTLVLASDPDREGEAIAWHLQEELKSKLKGKNVERVVFHEITKSAVSEAIAHPRQIDDNLVSAYMARRALDYLVGFTLSPVLWRKLPGSKSAGRVQSVALRLICEREAEIEQFKTEEYWTVDVDLITKTKSLIKSKLIQLDGKKLEKFDLNSEDKAFDAKAKIEAQEFAISNVERKKATRNPFPPFTTSTLQQEGARKLRYSAKRTMQVAQKLYEDGYITYMRTDAVNLSKEAIANAREVIQKYFGDEYLPKSSKEYKTKSKNAQEAHEAIRPSDLTNTPKKLEGKLDAEAHKLYELIWKRTIACQMNPAIMDRVTIDSTSKDGQIIVRANGQVIAFDGFLKLYTESKDDQDEDDENRILPNVDKGEDVNKGEIYTDQHWTQPPPRFTEASLVKRLEELGIGRPSTYASIIAVLQERKYVHVDKLRFIPEDRGRIVTVFLENYFKKYVEYDFTAQMEEFLDDVSNGKMDWKQLLTGFWTKFIAQIKSVEPLKITDVINKIEEALEYHLFPACTDGTDPRECPKCHEGRLNVKLGKFGAFLGCSRYPECDYTNPLNNTEEEENHMCPKDANPEDKVMGELQGQNVYLKKGPFGFYLQLGENATATTEKPKRAPLPKDIQPADLTGEQALTLISLPKDLGDGIELLNGKFGPYVKQGGKSQNLKDPDNMFNITKERAVELLKDVKERPQGKVLGQFKKNDIMLMPGRYGNYLKVGRFNYALPKELKEKEPTLEEALKVLETKK